jgi:hypothetical protein
MTVLVTADLHLSSNPRDSYRHDFVKNTLPELVVRASPRTLIILGDITDQKDYHSSELVNTIVEYLYALSRECPVIIMRGNHDCINPDMPFFGFVKHIPNITWITHPKALEVRGLGPCCFLPHTRNYKRDWKDISFAPFKRDPNCGVIFAHNTFDGADAGHGRKLSGIPTTVFPKQATVISGDIHLPQTLNQVTYVGAPYTVTFGDSYKPRLLQIGLTPSRKIQMQSIPCEGPQKCVVDIKKPRKSLDLDVNAGDMVKARVHLAAEDYAHWNEIQAHVRKEIERLGAIASIIQPVKANQAIKLQRKRKGGIQNDLELLETYSKRRGLTEDTMKTGKWIMEQI